MGNFSDTKTDAYIVLAERIALHVRECYVAYYDERRDTFRLKPRAIAVDSKYFWIPGKTQAQHEAR